MSTEETARGFLSYRRADNRDFRGVVDKLRQDVCAQYSAATGRPSRTIPRPGQYRRGEDWRDRIFSSIRDSTVFIPVITMRYFESRKCRQELLQFHETATQLQCQI